MQFSTIEKYSEMARLKAIDLFACAPVMFTS